MSGRRNSGVVYVEFLLAVIPMLLLWLGMVQLGLLGVAHMLVQYAANRAVRSAAVILSDDYYEETGDSNPYADVPLNRIGKEGEGVEAYKSAPEGGRYEAIRKVAKFPLMTLAPALSQLGISVTGATVEDAVRRAGWANDLINYFLYTDFAVGVGFVSGDDPDAPYVSVFGAQGAITVEVTYLYWCAVPVVRTLMCDRWDQLDQRAKDILAVNEAHNKAAGAFRQLNELAADAEKTLEDVKSKAAKAGEWSAKARELSQYAQAAQEEVGAVDDAVQDVVASVNRWSFHAPRYLVVRARATLPNQGKR